MRLAKMSGRACVPISSWSFSPRVMTSSVGSPLRSKSALVATVVPIFTAAMRSDGIGRAGGNAEEQPDGFQRRVVVGARVLRQELAGEDAAVGCACNDVGEGAAAVDPEVPLCVAGAARPSGSARRSPPLGQLSGVARRRQPHGHVAAACLQTSGNCRDFPEVIRNRAASASSCCPRMPIRDCHAMESNSTGDRHRSGRRLCP